jgi:glycosyltransferase involved in cell wall biosynthesis
VLTGPIDVFYSPDFLLPPLVGGVRTLLTIHDLSFLRHPETFPSALHDYLVAAVPKSAERADRILTDSEWTRRDVIELLDVPADRVSALHLGVSRLFGAEPKPPGTDATAERARLQAAYGLVPGPFVLAVGTVQPRKNLLRLVQAIDIVRETPGDQTQAVNLVIAGSPGWLAEPIFAAAKQRDYVQMLGFVAEADLPALYRQAQALAYPSLYEGFGLPPLEAMACGTPVIASRASSLPEAVGDAGLLIGPTDVDDMAQALARVLSDEDLRAELRTKGLQRAASFTWQRTAEEWLAAIEHTC